MQCWSFLWFRLRALFYPPPLLQVLAPTDMTPSPSMLPPWMLPLWVVRGPCPSGTFNDAYTMGRSCRPFIFWTLWRMCDALDFSRWRCVLCCRSVNPVLPGRSMTHTRWDAHADPAAAAQTARTNARLASSFRSDVLCLVKECTCTCKQDSTAQPLHVAISAALLGGKESNAAG